MAAAQLRSDPPRGNQSGSSHGWRPRRAGGCGGGALDTAMCRLFNALNCESVLFKSCYRLVVHHTCQSACTLTCVLAKFQPS